MSSVDRKPDRPSHYSTNVFEECQNSCPVVDSAVSYSCLTPLIKIVDDLLRHCEESLLNTFKNVPWTFLEQLARTHTYIFTISLMPREFSRFVRQPLSRQYQTEQIASESSDYRPISILSNFSETLEKNYCINPG